MILDVTQNLPFIGSPAAIANVVLFIIFVLYTFFQNRVKQYVRDFKDVLTRNTKIKAQIATIVYEMRLALHANRVNLFEYSNTDKSITGIPAEYTNCTYESVDITSASIKNKWIKVPTSHNTEWILAIEGGTNPVVFTDGHASTEIRNTLLEDNIKQIISFKIGKSIKDGVIGIAFIHEEQMLSNQHIEYVERKCWEILRLQHKMR